MMDNQPIITDAVPVPVEPAPANRRLWIIAGAVTVACILALLLIKNLLTAPKPEPIHIPPSPTPTPTPIRILSAVATQSAFLALEQAQASLSASLAGTNLDDPSLSPPVLDLPLGLRQ